jgi:hypothetical protein
MRRKRWRRIGGIVLVLFALIAIDWALYPRLTSVGGESRDQGRNGIWLRYKWYFGENPLADVPELGRRFQDHGIRYAFFHVRFIKKDGTLRFRYPDKARALNAAVRRASPATKSIAWIYAGNEQGEGEVDLADAKVRAAMVKEAVWLVRDCGFAGVQWDYEICPDGDPSLLKLLDETRAALPPGAFLGTCSPVTYPWPIAGFGWSEAYFGEVAKRCDQIATMTYDTGMLWPRMYVELVKNSTDKITRAVAEANPNCRVLVGLPSYGKGFLSHNPYAENLRLGLKGVRESSPDPRSFEGIAPFADYTMEPFEWEELRRWW